MRDSEWCLDVQTHSRWSSSCTCTSRSFGLLRTYSTLATWEREKERVSVGTSWAARTHTHNPINSLLFLCCSRGEIRREINVTRRFPVVQMSRHKPLFLNTHTHISHHTDRLFPSMPTQLPCRPTYTILYSGLNTHTHSWLDKLNRTHPTAAALQTDTVFAAVNSRLGLFVN